MKWKVNLYLSFVRMANVSSIFGNWKNWLGKAFASDWCVTLSALVFSDVKWIKMSLVAIQDYSEEDSNDELETSVSLKDEKSSVNSSLVEISHSPDCSKARENVPPAGTLNGPNLAVNQGSKITLLLSKRLQLILKALSPEFIWNYRWEVLQLEHCLWNLSHWPKEIQCTSTRIAFLLVYAMSKANLFIYIWDLWPGFCCFKFQNFPKFDFIVTCFNKILTEKKNV